MFDKILVPLDGSKLAEQALGRAAEIARASEATIDLVLVHEPLTVDGFTEASWTERRWMEEQRYLEDISVELQTGSGVTGTFEVVRAGNPVDMICERAKESQASLIVMSSHGRTGWNRFWLGSVADGVMRHSTVPVLMLHPMEEDRQAAARKPIRRVLVPLDGSDASLQILPAVEELARTQRATITLLRVVRPVPQISLDMVTGYTYTYPPLVIDQQATQRVVDESKRQLEHQAALMAEKGGLLVYADVMVEPHVAQGICTFATEQNADLIAMCTHGRGMSRLLLGSIADKVIRGCGLPMLVYHPISTASPSASQESDRPGTRAGQAPGSPATQRSPRARPLQRT